MIALTLIELGYLEHPMTWGGGGGGANLTNKTSLKGYKIKILEWNAEHGDSNERRHSTGSFETGSKTIGCMLLELEP